MNTMNTQTSRFKCYEPVFLIQDMPAKGLKTGDEGFIIEVYENPRRYEVEFLELDDEGVSENETYIVVNQKQADDYLLPWQEQLAASLRAPVPEPDAATPKAAKTAVPAAPAELNNELFSSMNSTLSSPRTDKR